MMQKKQFLVALGDRIRQLRSEQGISQAELARRCDRDRQSIERIENGKVNPSIFILYQISLAMGVSLVDMMPLSQ